MRCCTTVAKPDKAHPGPWFYMPWSKHKSSLTAQDTLCSWEGEVGWVPIPLTLLTSIHLPYLSTSRWNFTRHIHKTSHYTRLVVSAQENQQITARKVLLPLCRNVLLNQLQTILKNGHRDPGFSSSLHQFCKHLLCFGCCNDLKGPSSWEDALLNKGDMAEYSVYGFNSKTVYLA